MGMHSQNVGNNNNNIFNVNNNNQASNQNLEEKREQPVPNIVQQFPIHEPRPTTPPPISNRFKRFLSSKVTPPRNHSPNNNNNNNNVDDGGLFNLARAIQDTVLGKEPLDEDFEMYDMLPAINTVFSNIILYEPPALNNIDFGLVVGPTGAGKSTFIGYRNGATLIKKRHERYRKDILDYENDEPGYPKIGHVGAQTNGFEIFKKYIDTAGWFDPRDRAYKLCNAMSLKLAAMRFKINRLILVQQIGVFFTNRGADIIKAFNKKLAPRIQEVWDHTHSMAFIFTPSGEGLVTKKAIYNGVWNIIQNLLEEANAILQRVDTELIIEQNGEVFPHPKYVKHNNHENVLSVEEVDETLNDQLFEEERKEIEENQHKIIFFRGLLNENGEDLNSNIFIANLFDENNEFNTTLRKEIDEWEKTLGSDPLPFTQGGVKNEEIFRKTLIAIALYFVDIRKKLNTIKYEYNQLQSEITQINSNNLKKTLKKLISNRQSLINQVQQIIQNSENSIEIKKNDSAVTQACFKELHPTPPMRIRKFWNIWGTEHQFEYHTSENAGSVRLLKLDPKDKNGLLVGKFGKGAQFNQNDEPNLGTFVEPKKPKRSKKDSKERNVYRVSYKSNYYGYPEVLQVKMKVMVQKEEHPNFQLIMKWEEDRLEFHKKVKAIFEEVQQNFEGTLQKIINFQQSKPSPPAKKRKERWNELKEGLLVFLNDKLSKAQEKIDELQPKYTNYEPFCHLIRKILLEFKYHQPDQSDNFIPEEIDVFDAFCKFYQ